MKIKARRGLGLLAVAMAGFMTVAASTSAMAQQPQDPTKKDDTLRPPTPSKPDDSTPAVWNYFTMAVLIGLVALGALLPSKRGHQD